MALPGSATAQTHFPDDTTIRRLAGPALLAGADVAIVIGLLEADGSRRIVTVGDSAYNGATLFEIGSVTKVFTGILLAEMAERGELRLDQPVSTLLPSDVTVPMRAGRQITLIDLATHLSGLPRMPSNFGGTGHANPYAAYTAERLYAFLNGHELDRDPGAKFEYSNLGVGLLGHALSTSSGAGYEDLLAQRVLEPLGLRSTRITLDEALEARLAPGHSASGRPGVTWPNSELSALQGAGALRSTVEDLLTFLAANLSPSGGSVGRAIGASHQPRHEVRSRQWMGLGWMVTELFDGVLMQHGGATGGYRSFVGFDPERRVGVVVLTNASRDVQTIALHLLEPRFPVVGVPQAIAYLLLVLAVAMVLVAGAFFVWRRTAARAPWRAALIAFLAVVVVLGGSLAVGIGTPQTPALLLSVVAMALAALWIGRSRIGVHVATGLPFAVLIGMQTFRLALELIMHRTYEHGVLPLGRGGYTVDALFGLFTAALVLQVVFGRATQRLVRVWNWLGIVSLVNIAAISAQNPWIGISVFVWIPSFLLPFGLLGHALVFQRLRNATEFGRAALAPPITVAGAQPGT
jgi:serine-type D-Ala-D-Ala carboxypeptidase/endopeptidase